VINNCPDSQSDRSNNVLSASRKTTTHLSIKNHETHDDGNFKPST
jgi:hypothetical protein